VKQRFFFIKKKEKMKKLTNALKVIFVVIVLLTIIPKSMSSKILQTSNVDKTKIMIEEEHRDMLSKVIHKTNTHHKKSKEVIATKQMSEDSGRHKNQVKNEDKLFEFKRFIISKNFFGFLNEHKINLIKNETELLVAPNETELIKQLINYIGEVAVKKGNDFAEESIVFLSWVKYILESTSKRDLIQRLKEKNIPQIPFIKIIKDSDKMKKTRGFIKYNKMRDLDNENNKANYKRNFWGTPDNSLENCPIQRDQIKSCGMRFFDLNKDHILTREEIEAAKKRYPPTWLKFAASVVEKLNKMHIVVSEPISEVMRKCSTDGERITISDFDTHKNTCLENCHSVMDAWRYFCEPARNEYYSELGNSRSVPNNNNKHPVLF
jgi:hypothetical protein